MKSKKEEIKIAFLDIDGVLQTYGQITSFGGALFDEKHNPIDKDKVFVIKSDSNVYHCINLDTVKNLKKLVDKTGVKVVLSSFWRYFAFKDQLVKLLSDNGIEIYDETRNVITFNELLYRKIAKNNDLVTLRIVEVDEYIKRNKIKNYVVLDDLNMTHEFGKRMILTDYNSGFDKTSLKLALKVLS